MRTLMLALGLMLAACDGGGEACDEDGATRCMDNAVETCATDVWELEEDCGSGTCMQTEDMMEGEAHCM